MARKDIGGLISWIRSDKDTYFYKGIRTIGYILPMALKTHDRLTVESLLENLVKVFWYWDARVPKVKSWKSLEASKLDALLMKRERMRMRRDEVRSLLMKVREVAEAMRNKPKGKKHVKSLARKVIKTIDECERKWDMLMLKRLAEGEYEGRWRISVI